MRRVCWFLSRGALHPPLRPMGEPPCWSGGRRARGEWGQEPPVWFPQEETGEAGYMDLGSGGVNDSIGLGEQGRLTVSHLNMGQ